MRPPSPSTPEKDFFFAALDAGHRLDGRAFSEPRAPALVFGPALGHAELALGKTRVLAQVDARVVRPEPTRPFEGVLSVHAELSPMAAGEVEPGRQSEEEISLARMLDKIFRRADAIDREALCILAGERVWHVRLALHVLADAGNALDAAVLAGSAALRHFRRPDAEVVGRAVTLHAPDARAPVPLALHYTPFCVSYALFAGDGEEDVRALLDPGLLEARLAHGTLALALTPARELAVVHKAGGLPLAPAALMRAVRAAARRAQELDAWLGARVRDDWARKRVEVR